MREKREIFSPDSTVTDQNLRLRFRREQRAIPTRIEEILWRCLRGRRFQGLKFRRQHSIGPYIADFYCEEHQLVVEADGPVHAQTDQRTHDASRDGWMHSHGIMVVRLPQDEILMATDRALARIERALR